MYCLSVHSFFLVSFTSMYTTLKIISRKFLGVSLIWTFFSHVGAIFYETALTDRDEMSNRRTKDDEVMIKVHIAFGKVS